MQYGLSGQYMLVQCGLSTDINIYVQAMGFTLFIQYQLVEWVSKANGELAISYLHFLMKIKRNTCCGNITSGDESCIVSHERCIR